MTAADDFNLSASERLALEELRKRISKDLKRKVYDETHLLYRFLKARNFDVDQAEIMLRNNLEWRKRNDLDTITTLYKPPEVLHNYFANMKLAFAKNGRIVYYLPLGKVDVRGMFMSAKPAEIEKYIIYILETAEHLIEEQIKKLGKQVNGVIFIYDVAELSFANASDKRAIELLIRLFKNIQDNYPERLKSVLFINASSIFTVPFSIIKNFLASSILEKVQIHGSDSWKEELAKIVDEDQLPAFLGGKRTDPDGNPLCLKTVNHAGKIDEKYYVHKSKRSLSNNPEAKKLVIDRASFSEIPIKIKEAGSLIEWEFETKTRDVGFGLFFKEIIGEEERIVELVPLQRLETEDFAETGIYKCEKAGDYIMLFDNSYSWVRSKEIYYRATVVNPKDHEKQINMEA